MDGGNHPTAGEKCAEDGQGERENHERHVPYLQHVLLFLNHYGVEIGRGGEPRHDCRVFHRVPSPIASQPNTSYAHRPPRMLPADKKNHEVSAHRRVVRIQTSPNFPVASAAMAKAKGMEALT